MFNVYGPSSPTLASRSPVIIHVTCNADPVQPYRSYVRMFPDARSRILAPRLCTPDFGVVLTTGHGSSFTFRYRHRRAYPPAVAKPRHLFCYSDDTPSSTPTGGHPAVMDGGTSTVLSRNAGTRTRDFPDPNGARYHLRYIPKMFSSIIDRPSPSRHSYTIPVSDPKRKPFGVSRGIMRFCAYSRNAGTRTRDFPDPNGARCHLRYIP